MKQAEQTEQSALLIGFTSVANILQNISKETVDGNALLKNLKRKFYDFSNTITKSVTSLINPVNNSAIKPNPVLLNISVTLTSINFHLLHLIEILENKEKKKESPEKKLEEEFSNIFEVISGYKDKLIKGFADFQKRFTLENLKSVTKNKISEIVGNKKEDKTNPSVHFIESIVKNMDEKFIKNYGKFIDLYEKMIDEKNNIKFEKFQNLLLKFSVGMKTMKATFDSVSKVLLSIGFSVVLLAGALLMTNFVEWGSVFKLLGFLTGLGLIIKTFGKSSIGGVKDPLGLIAISGSIGILTLALLMMNYVNWGSVLMLIIFIGALGATVAFANMLMSKSKSGGLKGMSGGGTGIFALAAGIALLVLSLAAIGEIDFGASIKLIFFITAVGLAIALPSLFMKSGKMGGIFGFAAGMAILVLVVAVTGELDWSSAWKLILFIAGIGLAIALPGLIGSSGKTGGLFGFAIGVAILVLIVAVTAELNWTPAMYLIGFIAGIGLAFRIMPANSTTMMIALAFSTMLIVGVIWAMSQIDNVVDNILYLALAVGTLVVLYSLVGAADEMIILGVVGVLLLGVSALIIAFTLSIISGLDFDNVPSFILAVGALAIGFLLLLPAAIGAVITSVLLIVIGTAAMIVAGALAIISVLNITPKAMDGFNYGIKSIVNTFNDFGIIELGKAVIKSALLIPITAVMIFVALGFKAIEALSVDNKAIDNFGALLNTFITTTTDAINSSLPALESAQGGLDALAKLINVSSGLVDIVRAFAGMTYNVYEVQDGQLVLTDVHKITDDEIAQVGVSVGKLLQGLLNPLLVMSSDDETWDFGGGMKIKNPFKGGLFGDNNSGANRIGKIGEAFKPLVDSIANFASLGIAQDQDALQSFSNAIRVSVSMFSWAFDVLENFKNQNAPDSIKNIGTLMTSFQGLQADNINSISTAMKDIIENLADDDKWGKINKNLKATADNFAAISTSINMINLEKAMALERNLKMMTDATASDNLAKILESLKDLFGLIKDSQEKQNEILGNFVDNTSSTDTKQDDSGFSFGGIVKKAPEEKKITLQELMSDLKNSNDLIGATLTAIDTKLKGKLKVAVVDGNPNSI